jgi:superfamily II DNA or RNA helicase
VAYFEDHAAELRPIQAPPWGLRRGQIGGAWAVAAHFTVSTEPAQVVLPTGTGKTALMTLLPFLLRTNRLLIVTPSKIVRDQCVSAFTTLNILSATRTVPQGMPSPNVWSVKHQLRTRSQWSDLEEFDVVVGTTQVLSPAYSGVAPAPTNLFDAVFVDEGHHSPATTWRAILDHFRDARQVLLTATPFRHDRLHLPGNLVYAYPLRLAIDEGVYAPIQYVAVDATEPGVDTKIAEKARERLHSAEHQEARSALLVRTDRIKDAEDLIDLYRGLGIELVFIRGTDTLKQVQGKLRALEDGTADGIVSVSVLGEGFDLPRLKIAAYHRPHQSLAATLQFIGRLSRVSNQHPVTPELIAVREAVQDETRRLYLEDASWAELVPLLSEAAIEREQSNRQYVGTFSEPNPAAVSLHATCPARQAVIFELGNSDPDLEFSANSVTNERVVLRELDAEGGLLLLITEATSRPPWLRSQALDRPEYQLHVVVKCLDEGWLFVNTSTQACLDDLLGKIGSAGARLAPPSALNRLLWAAGVSSYSSIGMRSAYTAGGRVARYQVLAGPEVQGAVDPGAPALFGVGHLIGHHLDDNQQARVIGVSTRRSKVWSADYVTLLEYKTWCNEMAAMMNEEGEIASTAPLLELQMPVRLDKFPEHPLAGLLDARLLSLSIQVQMPSGDVVDLGRIDIVPSWQADDICRLDFAHAGESWSGSMNLDGQVFIDAGDGPSKPLANVPGQGWVQLSEVLTAEPPSLVYPDGSLSRGPTLFQPTTAHGPVSPNLVRKWDWTGCQITAEVGATMAHKKNVQDHAAEILRQEYPAAYLITDHASGELADLVVLDNTGDFVMTILVHCKASGDAQPGLRVDDLYEVCGQAVRSQRWAFPRLLWPEAWNRFEVRNAMKVLSGDASQLKLDLAAWAANAPTTRMQVWIVQPGLKADSLSASESCTALLRASDSWLGRLGIDLRVIGS